MAPGSYTSNVGIILVMNGIAWERVNWTKKLAVEVWLKETFGPSTPTTWYLEHDYDLEALIFNEEIAVMYFLKWP